MVLLPTSTNKLLAQWQGPYTIICQVGEVNYEVDMHDRRKRQHVFHMNMLCQWNATMEMANLVAESVEPQTDGDTEAMEWGHHEDGKPNICEGLREEQRKDLQKMLRDFTDVLQSEPGRTTLAEHRIDIGEAKPIRQVPYGLTHAYCELVKKELQEMRQRWVIEPSMSDWAFSVVLVTKKDRTIRFCVDEWRLNGVAYMDAYPIPRVDDLLDQLGRAKYITTLDLSRGYWQVPMAEEARKIMAFTTPFGLYQFNPLGAPTGS